MDFIDIVGLEVKTIIGVNAEERYTLQPLYIFLRLGVSFEEAYLNDNISSTVDYDSLTNFIIQYTSEKRFYLIETLAHNIIEELFKQYARCQSILIRIEKPEALISVKTVAIEMHRERLS